MIVLDEVLQMMLAPPVTTPAQAIAAQFRVSAEQDVVAARLALESAERELADAVAAEAKAISAANEALAASLGYQGGDL